MGEEEAVSAREHLNPEQFDREQAAKDKAAIEDAKKRHPSVDEETRKKYLRDKDES